MTTIKGLDASFDSLTDDIADRLRADRYEVYAQCLWTGTQTPSTAQQNLRVALAHGFTCLGYISLTSRMLGAWHVSRGKQAVSQDIWDQLVLTPIDVELRGIQNSRIRQALEATSSHGKRPCIYTSYGCWTGNQGNTTEFAGALLWNAWWDADEDIDFMHSPYGGWTMDQLVGEQYMGGHDIHGLHADSNVFIKETLLPGSEPEEPEEPTPEERLARCQALLIEVTGRNELAEQRLQAALRALRGQG